MDREVVFTHKTRVCRQEHTYTVQEEVFAKPSKAEQMLLFSEKLSWTHNHGLKQLRAEAIKILKTTGKTRQSFTPNVKQLSDSHEASLSRKLETERPGVGKLTLTSAGWRED